RHTLHRHVAVSFRRCGSPCNHYEESTLRPREYRSQCQCLQSIRDRSRTLDDFLGSFSVSFWFCKLHNSFGNRLSRLSLSSAQLDELLVFPVQRRDDDSQLLLRGSTRSWLDTLFTTDRGSVWPLDRNQSRGWRANPKGCLDNDEFNQFSGYDVQDESTGSQAEVHVCISVGYSRNDFHDALCFSIVSRRGCSTLCRQSFWHCVFLVDPGRVSALGQCILVLRAS